MYGIRADIQGMTESQYEQIMHQVQTQLQAQPGFITHLAGPTHEGWYVIEAWRSQDDFGAWIQEIMQPIFQAAGIAVPQIQELSVQNSVSS
jgi:heme-degrading monooxygenase HmoA